MTREEAKAFAPILKAYSEGKTIQIRRAFGDCAGWSDWPDPDFTGDVKDYRVKPEPRIVWVVFEDGDAETVCNSESAAKIAAGGQFRGTYAKFREVID